MSTARNITEYHVQQMHEQREIATLPTTQSCRQQVAEIDGCMLPIVTIDNDAADKRKQKKLHWQEVRLALVHEQGSATPRFDATFGGVNEAGQSLLNCAVAAGFGTQTHLHGVGDGAFWIADQIEQKFGSQASYLADFYPICEYLAEASKTCVPNNSKSWMEAQKSMLKNNDYAVVIENITVYLEADDIENNKASVRACHRV